MLAKIVLGDSGFGKYKFLLKTLISSQNTLNLRLQFPSFSITKLTVFVAIMKHSFSFAALVILSGLASSHTIFTQLTIDGVTYGIGEGIRVPSYDGPIEDVSTVHIAVSSPNLKLYNKSKD